MFTIIFIILKLVKVLNCSWWWILLALALDGVLGNIFGFMGGLVNRIF